jgi:RHS repeat-associated protein
MIYHRVGGRVVFLICLSAFAQTGSLPVPSTGQNVSGGRDTSYQIIADTTGEIAAPAQAFVGTDIPAWVTIAGAQWIGPSADQSNATRNPCCANTADTYRTTFSLSGVSLSDVAFSIFISADDYVDVLLNGQPVFTHPDTSMYGLAFFFSLNSGFVSGINTLDFVVTNSGGPTGLIVAVIPYLSPQYYETTGQSYTGGCNCGDPISVGTGNLFEQVTDYSTTGLNKLAFSRSYSSLGSAATFASELGGMWRSTYDRYLRIVSASSVIAERADGQQVTFNLNGITWTPSSDVDLTLTNSGSTWTLTDSNDVVETYTTIGSTEAVATSVQARNGYTQTLHYNSGNQLLSVKDSYNRTLTFTYQNGLLQTVTTPDGLVLTYSYTSSGFNPGVLDRLASVSYSTTPTTSQSYLYENANLPFALTGIVDEDGNRYATWTYDQFGRGLTSQHGAGADLITIAYNDTDGSRTVTNALGERETYKFTILQGVPKLTESDRLATASTAAATQTFTYDSNGYEASVTDWNGNLTTYVNDLHGRPTTISEAVGTPQARTTTTTYLSNFHLPSQIVMPELSTNFTYDSSGNLLTKTLTDTTTTSVPYSTNGQKRTWTYTWANSLLASALGPRTDVSEPTKLTYDSGGALTATTNALGQAMNITQHTPGGLPQTIVDPNGVTTNLTYDARLRLLTSTLTTSAGPLSTKYAYDPAGNLLNLTLPDGSAVTNTYDAAHRLTGMADLFTNSVAYTLDAAGDRTNTAVSNPQKTVTRQHSATFDALGRLLDDVGGVGQTTAYAYDSNGNAVAVTDPLQRITQQTFDSLNRRITITNPAQGSTAFTYDPLNRPLSVTDPNGNTTTYTYDGFGDVIQEVSPARGTTVYHYDPDGNLVQKIDGRGATANYTYDALDRVTATTYTADTLENVTYTYDQAAGGFGIGRLTSVADAVGTLSRTYDERGNVLTESRVRGSGASAVTLRTKYTYDAASRMASITYPSGTAVAYARDGMGRVTGVTAQPLGAAQPTPVLSEIAYLPFGPPNALTYGNGVAESRSFDLDYRLTALAGTGNNPIESLTYGYNAANDVLSITDGVTSGNSQSFGYDALDRLTSASGGYGTLAYTYDANGNRLSANLAAATLDGLGSITGLAYNQAGRLASTSAGTQQVTQYTYDAFGHRLTKLGNVTATTLFQYGRGGELLEETGAQGNVQADYIYLDGRPIAEFNAGKLYFLHDDRLGTPQVATDSTQATVWVGNYQPFGALSASSQTALLGQDIRFPGQENDLETGLYHNGFRNYMPGLGRYLESDPGGLAGGLNTYAYANGNPVKFTDPLGLCSADENQPGEVVSGTACLGLCLGLTWNGAGNWYVDVGFGSPSASISYVVASDMGAYSNGWTIQGGSGEYTAGGNLSSSAAGYQIGTPLPSVSATYGCPASDFLACASNFLAPAQGETYGPSPSPGDSGGTIAPSGGGSSDVGPTNP